jgi:hypothetical protein
MDQKALASAILSEHTGSDALEAAITAHITVRYGIIKNCERAGEPLDGEKIARRSMQAAISRYVEESDLVRAALNVHEQRAAAPQEK